MIHHLFIWLIILNLASFSLSAQWSEDFDNISELPPPPWRGQIADFAIIKNQLKLYVEYPEDVNESRIAITVPYFTATTWKGNVQLDFQPTTNNYLYYYLYCYNEINDTEFKYIALRWGGGSKGVDLVNVQLKILPSGESKIIKSETLINGSKYPLGKKPSTYFIVTYEIGTGWQLWVNANEYTNNQTVSIGKSSFDIASPFQSGGLGIDCFYTKSRSKAFNFDNLSVSQGIDAPEDDNMPPLIPLGQPSLNELMANPLEGGDEYIELYNSTDKPVVPDHFSIAILKKDGYTNPIAFPSEGDTLYPGEYIVFAKTKEGVLSLYPEAKNVFTMSNLPQLANKGFQIALFENNNSVPIEEVIYSPQLLGEGNITRKGVALERISTDVSASNYDNWSGGLKSSGYATPGYLNSQSSHTDTTLLYPSIEEDENMNQGESYTNPKKIATEIKQLPQGSLCGSIVYLLSGKTIKYMNGYKTKYWCRNYIEGDSLQQSLGLQSGSSYMIVVWIQKPNEYIYARKFIVLL